MFRILLIIICILPTTLFAIAPARTDVTPSPAVREASILMSETYRSGGVYDRIANFKAAAEQGALREDVYMAFPVLMAYYADSQGPAWMVDDLQAQLFDGPWETITMAEHYEEMSYGQFHLSGTVYGQYQLSQNHEYYEGSQTPPYDNGFFGPPGGVADFMQETLTMADLEVDFSLFDSDGPDGLPNSGDDDGYVDAVFFTHSGIGGEYGGPEIWSHRWAYSGLWGEPFTTDDSAASGGFIQVNDYIMQPAESANDDGVIEIGVFSHEFGHALGLPDLYDTDYSSGGVGSWCLMASGSYQTEETPAHMNAWCKEMLGWLTPMMVTENTDLLEIPNVEFNPFAVKVWTDGVVEPHVSGYSHGQDVGQQYYLIENRQALGADVYLDNEGLLIWHVDNTQWTNSDEFHRLVDIRGADDYVTIPGNATSNDPWPGPTNSVRFDYHTIPSAINHSGENTGVAVFDIFEGDTSIFASFEVQETVPHLFLWDYQILDDNNDGFLSPGEDGEIWLELVNYGVNATGVTATIVAEEAAFSFTADELTFNDIPYEGTMMSESPFEFTMAQIFEPGPVMLQAVLESAETAMMDTVEFQVIIGDPQVTLVDDDGAENGDNDVQNYYVRALADQGIVFKLWDTAVDGMPSTEWILTQPDLIWFSGNNETPLTDTTMAVLSAYQDAGGRLLLSGQHMAVPDQPQASFLREYCGAVYDETVTNQVYVFGDPEHEMMSAADQFIIGNDYGANNQTSPDVITRRPYARSLFQYPLLDYRLAGTTVTQNDYKTAFLAFGFEAIAPLDGEGWDIRADLLARILEWFDGQYVEIDYDHLTIPQEFGILSHYPNPFNPSIAFKVNVPENSVAELQIFDLQGKQVAALTVSGSGNTHWAPRANVAGGIYFSRLILDSEIQGEWVKLTYLK